MFTGDGGPRKFVYRADSTQPSKSELQRAFIVNEQHPRSIEVASPFKAHLFGSDDDMFSNPTAGMFTGDGAPRKFVYRADSTQPSKSELQRAFIANEQHPQPAEAAPPSKAHLFGSGHGIFSDPTTGMFVGDGAPRKSSYRADSTQPFKSDLQRDFIVNEQRYQPAEASPPSKVPLFGSGHGMFLDPATGMFIGDGPPRQFPYRADGTLPSKPDLQRDFFANVQHPQPAEDMFHIQSKREVTKRLANFGKNGPVQTFRLGRPMPQGNQQATRVMVPKEEDGGVPLGRRVYTADEMAADLARLAATGTGKGDKTGVKEKDFGAEDGEAEEEENKKKEFEGTVLQDFAIRKGKGRYAGAF